MPEMSVKAKRVFHQTTVITGLCSHKHESMPWSLYYTGMPASFPDFICSEPTLDLLYNSALRQKTSWKLSGLTSVIRIHRSSGLSHENSSPSLSTHSPAQGIYYLLRKGRGRLGFTHALFCVTWLAASHPQKLLSLSSFHPTSI